MEEAATLKATRFRKVLPAVGGAVLGSVVTTMLLLWIIPALTAAPPSTATCDPRHPPPATSVSFPPGYPEEPSPIDLYGSDTYVLVVYALNTGEIRSAVMYDASSSGGDPWLREDERTLNVTNDPNRDAMLDEMLCGGPLTWRVDPWAAVLVRS